MAGAALDDGQVLYPLVSSGAGVCPALAWQGLANQDKQKPNSTSGTSRNHHQESLPLTAVINVLNKVFTFKKRRKGERVRSRFKL